MKRSAEAAAATRRRAVAAAARLFRGRGFDGVGLERIMRAIGLTHGGFYRHFASKDALAAEAIDAASVATTSAHAALADHDGVQAVVERYLSAEHVAHPERGCPLAALAGAGGRQPAATRRAFARAIERALTLVTGVVPRPRAIAALATMVGGVVLARAVIGTPLADEILAAARAAAAPPPSA